MGDRLKGKVALVTGSGQGVGREIALAMAREGAKVVTNNRWTGTLGGDAETTAKEIIAMGGQAIPFFADITDFELTRKMMQAAVDKFGSIDILVNNAAIRDRNWLWDMTEEKWDRVVDVSLKGSFNCIRHACVFMKERRWGRIINATSRLRSLQASNYFAAKAGVVVLTRAAARELGPYGVTCNAYIPTAETRLNTSEDARAHAKGRYEAGLITKEYYEMLLTNLPAPEAVAPFVVYLATDEAANINGQEFRVIGGHIAILSDPMEQNPLDKEGGWWTVDELIELVPKVLLKGYVNPAPVRLPK